MIIQEDETIIVNMLVHGVLSLQQGSCTIVKIQKKGQVINQRTLIAAILNYRRQRFAVGGFQAFIY